MEYCLTNAQIKMPRLIYGTAWKKEKTAELVEQALALGFRGVDTACQPKHYEESAVGEGIARSGLAREDVFIQTKFTPMSGQDLNNIPYDPKSPLKEQVHQSIKRSKKNLKTAYLDSLVLHSPLKTIQETMQVWNVLEEYMISGELKQIGISNCYDFKFFKEFYDSCNIKPSIVQNRFYKESNYDIILRQFLRKHEIYYQSFWTLSANPHLIQSKKIQVIAKKENKTAEQILLRYLIQKDIIPLCGTTSFKHMQDCLDLFKFALNDEDLNDLYES